MIDGEQLRFRGPAGAPFVITVGRVFGADYIQARVKAGDWAPIEAPKPRAKRATRKV